MTIYEQNVSYCKQYNEVFEYLCDQVADFVRVKHCLVLDCLIHFDNKEGLWIAALYYKLLEEEQSG